MFNARALLFPSFDVPLSSSVLSWVLPFIHHGYVYPGTVTGCAADQWMYDNKSSISSSDRSVNLVSMVLAAGESIVRVSVDAVWLSRC